MGDGGGLWRLTEFDQRFEAWLARDNPTPDLSAAVAAWMLTRMEDPYEGAKREPGFPNLWSAQVAGSATGRPGDITVVLCSFWINESDHTVECDNFSILSYPV